MRLLSPVISITMATTLVATVVCFAVPARAQVVNITVPNFSFEDNAVPDGSGAPSFTGWVRARSGTPNPNAYTFDPMTDKFTGANGDNTALPGTAHGGQAALLQQSTGSLSLTSGTLATAQTEQRYTLTVAVGSAFNTNAGAARIDILANGVSVAFATPTFSSLNEGTFTDFSTNFTPTALQAGQNLSVRLSQSASGSEIVETYFDNVRFQSASTVPEPGTVALLGTGLLPLGALLRKRGGERRN